VIPAGSNSATWAGVSAPIYPIASQWADSVANVAVTIGGLSLVQPNNHARLLVNVPSGTKQLTVWLGNTLTSGVFSFDGAVGIWIDGVYSSELNAVGAASVVQPYYVTLDGAAHTVEIWAGYQQLGSTPLAFLGTQVYAVQGVGISLITPPAATRRCAFYGDSICSGGQATVIPRDSYFARLRGILPAGMSISQEAAGARSMWDDSGSGGGQQGFATQALLAARLAALVSGATTREVWLAMIYNDVNGAHWANAGAFGTAYGTLLDAIHSADPGIHVYAQGALHSDLDASTPAYSTAIQTAVSTRTSFAQYVDGFSLMAATGVPSGAHPTTSGHQAIALGTGGDAGATSIRAVLGI
jgi:hypothetical protein